MANCISLRATPFSPPPPSPTSNEDMLVLVNRERALNGVSPLSLNTILMTCAQNHAEYMARTGNFNHQGQGGAPNVCGVGRSTAENIAFGYTSITAAVEGWMKSHGHRLNILNGGYTQIGYGHAASYWVQVFTG